MSDTPKTDAAELTRGEIAEHDHGDGPFVEARFARLLERDLNNVIERCAQACGGKGDWRGQECADAIRALKGSFALSSARLATDLCDAPLDRTAIDAVAFDLRMTLYALLDRDITFDGRNAVLPFESHDQAINHISEARRKAR